jgi:hypothetical protein
MPRMVPPGNSRTFTEPFTTTTFTPMRSVAAVVTGVVGVVEMVVPVRSVNEAVTFCALVIESVQVIWVPLQAPPHPLNMYPTFGVAVRRTEPASDSKQSLPQKMPDGEERMVPPTVVDTERGYFWVVGVVLGGGTVVPVHDSTWAVYPWIHSSRFVYPSPSSSPDGFVGT